MDYGKILQRALQITWRYKVLWLFGLLAGVNLPSFRVGTNQLDALPPETQRAIAHFVTGPYFIPLIIGLFLLSFAAGIVISLINAAGKAALIHLVNRVEEGEEIAFPVGLQAVRLYAWRVFLIHFLLGLPVGLLVLAGILPFVLPLFRAIAEGRTSPPSPPAESIFFACGGICLGLLGAIVVSMIGILAERACILENLSVGRSIVRGWGHLTQHLGPVILLGLILLAIGIGISLAVGLPIGAIAVLLVALLASRGDVQIYEILLPLCGVGLFSWLVMLAVGSVVQTFTSSCWTLFYRGLAKLSSGGN